MSIEAQVMYSEAWRRAVTYACENVAKKWREEGRSGEVTDEFRRAWLTYYLAQQWDYRMPPGGLYSPKEAPCASP